MSTTGTARSATAAVNAAVAEVLRSLSSTLQIYSLYPQGHPDGAAAVDDLLAHVRSLTRIAAGDPALFVTRHSFYLGSSLLARESLSYFRLVETFEEAGIEAVEFLPSVDAEGLDALVRMLRHDLPLSSEIDGVAVNRVRPAIGSTGPVDLADLRRAYALGLETLRETASRIGSGRGIDLEATSRTVELLADEVAVDPAQALLLTTMKSYDEYTYYHMVNVCLLSIAMGQALGLHRDQVLTLGLAGLLHDVGKVEVPEEILNHPGQLDEEQWRLVQRHPVDGAGLIFATSEGLYHPAAVVALEHHATYDGAGYPRLHDRPLPSVPSRLIAVVDCFDAVTSRRPYRDAATRSRALRILQSQSGSGYDPRVVRVFTSLLGVVPIGSLVELDTGELGIVVRHHEELVSRPTVRIVLDADHNVAEGKERDLAERGPDGQFRWELLRLLDPDAAGIDIMGFLEGGPGDAEAKRPASPVDPEAATGLVHEPGHGEEPPEGYVDTHDHGDGHGHSQPHPHLDGAPDPDVAPGFDEPR